MKYSETILGFLLLLTIATPSAGVDGDEMLLTIATFNIHYMAEDQTDLAWGRRAEAAGRAVGATDADIIAFQEMETFRGGHFNEENLQADFIQERFPEYRFGATGNPESFPNTQPIAYRHDRLSLQEEGFFFFSETPDVIYSDPWDGRWPSFATWALFEDKRTVRRFYVFNVHFDFSSSTNRRNSAELVRQRILDREHHDLPVILLGDFNALRWFPTVREFRSLDLAPASPRGATYHFNRGIHLLPAIDHILVSSPFEVQEKAIVRANQSKPYASDHYPVVVTLKYR